MAQVVFCHGRVRAQTDGHFELTALTVMHILYNVTVAHTVVAPGLLHAVTTGNHPAKKGLDTWPTQSLTTNTTSAESGPLCVSVCACIPDGNLCSKVHMWSVDPRGELSHHLTGCVAGSCRISFDLQCTMHGCCLHQLTTRCEIHDKG